MVVCNVEEVLVDDSTPETVDDTDDCLVDFTERWIDCLLLLLAIEDEAEEEEVVVVLQLVVLVDDDAAAVGVVLGVLCILSTAISLSLFFDLYCRVDFCLVVVAILSVDVVIVR